MGVCIWVARAVESQADFSPALPSRRGLFLASGRSWVSQKGGAEWVITALEVGGRQVGQKRPSQWGAPRDSAARWDWGQREGLPAPR